MIALRGRVQLRKRGPEAENPPVDSSAVLASDGAALVGAASAPSTVTTDEKPNHKQLPLSIGTAETSTGASCTEDAASSIEEWEWSGEWSFGTIVDEKSAPNARLPFSYTWIRPVAKKTPEPAARSTELKESKLDSKESGTATLEAKTTVSAGEQPVSKVASESVNEKIEAKEPAALSLLPEQGASAVVTTAPPVLEDVAVDVSKQQLPAQSDSNDSTLPQLSPTVEFFGTTLPASGLWHGAFDTLVGRKGQQKRKPIPEHFVLTWTNVPDDSILPVDSSGGGTTSNKATALADDNTTKVLPNHVYVSGRGENQYGNFVFVGSLDTVTGILQCKKCYVASLSDEPNDDDKASTQHTPHASRDSAPRPYQTRKRQMSWKRRASYDTDDQGNQNEVEVLGPDGEYRKQPPLKKQRLMVEPGSRLDDDVVVMEGTSSTAATMTKTASASGAASEGIMVASAVTKRPSSTSTNSPSRTSQQQQLVTEASASTTATTGPKKRTSSVSSSNKGAAASGGGTTAASTMTAINAQQHAQPGQMKLPAAGDPHKARWRAAHFLYYHRDDPAATAAATSVQPNSAEGTNGASGQYGPTNASSTASASPMYLVYEGEMLNSQRHGRGVCLYNNGMMYEGDWRRDKEQGFGTLMSADRKFVFYKGEWERGRMHGTGVYYYTDKRSLSSQHGGSSVVSGSRYEGEFKENLRHGSGTYVLPDKSTYVGQWREGFMCGRGVFTWPDGSVYDGEWKDGKRHGIGLLKTSDGFSYDGAWVHNCMEGRGSATYPNGQQYNGLFSRGRREGRGTILFTNGAVYEGRFRDDAIDGQGTMKMSRTMVVPQRSELDGVDDADEMDIDGGESGNSSGAAVSKKLDFMIPVSFQSDMGHIHRKAGFTNLGM